MRMRRLRAVGLASAAALAAVVFAACTTGTGGGGGRTASSTPTAVTSSTRTSTPSVTFTPTWALALRTPVAYSRQQVIAPLTSPLQQVYGRVTVIDPNTVADARPTAAGPGGAFAVRTPAPGTTPSAGAGELESVLSFPSGTVATGDQYLFTASTAATPVTAFPTAAATIPAVLAIPAVTAPAGTAASACWSPVNVTATAGAVSFSWSAVTGATFYVLTAFPISFCVPSSTPIDTAIVPFWNTTASLSNFAAGSDYMVTILTSDMTVLSTDPLRNGDVSTYSFWLHAN